MPIAPRHGCVCASDYYPVHQRPPPPTLDWITNHNTHYTCNHHFQKYKNAVFIVLKIAEKVNHLPYHHLYQHCDCWSDFMWCKKGWQGIFSITNILPSTLRMQINQCAPRIDLSIGVKKLQNIKKVSNLTTFKWGGEPVLAGVPWHHNIKLFFFFLS